MDLGPMFLGITSTLIHKALEVRSVKINKCNIISIEYDNRLSLISAFGWSLLILVAITATGSINTYKFSCRKST